MCSAPSEKLGHDKQGEAINPDFRFELSSETAALRNQIAGSFNLGNAGIFNATFILYERENIFGFRFHNLLTENYKFPHSVIKIALHSS